MSSADYIHNGDVGLPSLSKDVNGHADDDDDVFSSGEEEVIKKMQNMRMSQGGGRRLSSLEIYDLQEKQETATNYLLKSKKKIEDVLYEVQEYENDLEAQEKKREQERINSSNAKRNEILTARMEKNENKKRQSEVQNERIKKVYSGKKLGILTKEKRSRLKQMLMQKAKETMHEEQMKLMQRKQLHIKNIVKPLDLDGMDDANLAQLVKDLHERARLLLLTNVELEEKIETQNTHIHHILLEIQTQRGHYAVPVLRKVNRNVSRMEKLKRLQDVVAHAKSQGNEAK